MGELIRAKNWSETPIGPVDSWSPALRMMVRSSSRTAFRSCYGGDRTTSSMYNDPCRRVVGKKDSWAFDVPVRGCWSEIWHLLQPKQPSSANLSDPR
jgi:hypothetical protein